MGSTDNQAHNVNADVTTAKKVALRNWMRPSANKPKVTRAFALAA